MGCWKGVEAEVEGRGSLKGLGLGAAMDDDVLGVYRQGAGGGVMGGAEARCTGMEAEVVGC